MTASLLIWRNNSQQQPKQAQRRLASLRERRIAPMNDSAQHTSRPNGHALDCPSPETSSGLVTWPASRSQSQKSCALQAGTQSGAHNNPKSMHTENSTSPAAPATRTIHYVNQGLVSHRHEADYPDRFDCEPSLLGSTRLMRFRNHADKCGETIHLADLVEEIQLPSAQVNSLITSIRTAYRTAGGGLNPNSEIGL